MAKRKYEKVVGYWVYIIQVPSVGKFYIGISKRQCSHRWRKSKYKDNSLEPYLDEWENMVKTVIQDNLTKEEALKYEDALIQSLKMNDLCINERRSGLIKASDINAYQRECYKNNQEHKKQWYKQYRKDNKERINEKRRQRYQKKKLEKQQHTVVD